MFSLQSEYVAFAFIFSLSTSVAYACLCATQTFFTAHGAPYVCGRGTARSWGADEGRVRSCPRRQTFLPHHTHPHNRTLDTLREPGESDIGFFYFLFVVFPRLPMFSHSSPFIASVFRQRAPLPGAQPPLALPGRREKSLRHVHGVRELIGFFFNHQQVHHELSMVVQHPRRQPKPQRPSNLLRQHQ
jgi:hypothetical protein